MRARDGNVQLYLGICPGTCEARETISLYKGRGGVKSYLDRVLHSRFDDVDCVTKNEKEY